VKTMDARISSHSNANPSLLHCASVRTLGASAALGFAMLGRSLAGVATAGLTFERLANPGPRNWLVNHHNCATMLFVFGL
jgi:hypothetical protein